ncbi:DUF2996 domain-containing protein [Oscillatoria sp. CS-180]|uniref:DUF2996 domain-containing protein n=1 Tax=Oscillatoria sp. CS-180 TaxID=3021720 RepID=UPI002330A21C|nr:DUF2996 domain-containing protein [Oscillatoria sp. CS-180]MDB9528124.1 DUF2996 domain-containing protein [Oscillatoria sp. CS-180]
MAEENTTQSSDQTESSTTKPAAKAEPKAKAKKEKPPKIEDKPFGEFMEQHFVPELSKALKEEGWEYVELTFKKAPLAVKGASAEEDYWQVQGDRPIDIDQQFNIVFSKEDIKGPKFFYYTQGNSPSSTVEQFMGDERRITLGLMVLYTVQRLNGQKWLARN